MPEGAARRMTSRRWRRSWRRRTPTARRSTAARSPASSTPPTARSSSATCCSPSTTGTRPSSSRARPRESSGILGLYRSGPQITTKCRQLVVAAGSYPAGAAEPTIKSDVAAARKLFAEWPTPIVAVGSEVGEALPYPGASIETDFAWAPAHPVVDAYRALKPMPYDAPAPALAAVLYAVHPDDGYFKLSDPGTITVLDDGRTQFTPAADGKHRYLIVDPAQKERVISVYSAMVSAAPAPRPAAAGGDCEGPRNETSRRCCRSRRGRADPGREPQVVRAGACRRREAAPGSGAGSGKAEPAAPKPVAKARGRTRPRLPRSPSRCSRKPAASATTRPTSRAGSTSVSSRRSNRSPPSVIGGTRF